jgi:hypothetical protein
MNSKSCVVAAGGCRRPKSVDLGRPLQERAPHPRAMAHLPRTAIILLAGATLLAGCTLPSPETSSTPTGGAVVDASTYTIRLDWTLASLDHRTASNFTFTEHIEGSVGSTSMHIGAHMGMNHTATPSTTVYKIACRHYATPNPLPGTYTITCDAPQTPGTYYLRGHARVNQNGTDINWWSPEVSFTVT